MAMTASESEAEALQARLEELDREHTERIARAHDAVAAAQDRTYWLDRWNLDPSSLMRKRGAGVLRAGVRAARSVSRRARNRAARAQRR
jgi:hypothetical protein